jgi:hypothetical protein
MLFKKVLTQYGRSMRGRPTSPQDDLIHYALDELTGDTEDLLSFRADILDAMKLARPFFLDHNAADYLDILGDTMVDEAGGPDETDRDFMKDIMLPEDVVWIEYDAKALAYAKRERGARNQTPPDEIEELNLRGILFDNRDPEHLLVRVFKTHKSGGLIDPMSTAVMKKDRRGYPSNNEYTIQPTLHMVRYLSLSTNVDLDPHVLFNGGEDGTIHLYRMSYCLFAALNDRSNDMVVGQEDTFSEKEVKNARKFSKSYILESRKSHLTIRLGEPGLRYLKQRRDDETDRRLIASGRAAPVRHEVREHERRYKSGKIVKVRAHVRGASVDTRPTRITAPSQDRAPDSGDDGPSL